MRRRRRTFRIASALALLGGTAQAWAPETRIALVDDAVRLLPASLRVALQAQREPLLRGMLEPMTGEDGPEHRPAEVAGGLAAAVSAEAGELAAALLQPGASFSSVARRFGALAHYVADAGFPPAAGAADDARYAHFSGFCESRREKFPLVFYGHEDAELAAGDFRGFALRLLDRGREDDRLLAAAYAAAGEPPAPAAFDDRSIPFALGSLAYSRSVTHIVRAWLAAWRAAGGDVGRTPYWKPPTAPIPPERP